MSRSLNPSLTVIFPLTALPLFGGATIRPFPLALLVGIISGTYSSIFNASMILVMWDKGELSLRRFRRDRTLDKRDKREERELARTRGKWVMLTAIDHIIIGVHNLDKAATQSSQKLVSADSGGGIHPTDW